MTIDELAEIFCDSPCHHNFNSALRFTPHRWSLLAATQQDVAAFLMRCPNDWIVSEPVDIVTNIATDFLDRWPAVNAA